jgi:hypothetical protein
MLASVERNRADGRAGVDPEERRFAVNVRAEEKVILM